MSPRIPTFFQDPEECLDYQFHFEDALEDGETITSYEFKQEPSGLTTSNDSQADGIVTVFLQGGALGRAYLVTCRAVSSVTPRVYERSMWLRMEER